MNVPNPFRRFIQRRPRAAQPLEAIHGLPTPAVTEERVTRPEPERPA